MTNINRNYIILKMFSVGCDGNKRVFSGKIRFIDLYQTYKLTKREIGIDSDDANDQFFQRQIDGKRVKGISSYVEEAIDNEKTIFFPSSIILANDSYTDYFDSDVVITDEIISDRFLGELDYCFYKADENNSDLYNLYIPKSKDITLIVDGQHRFVGVRDLYEKYKNDLLQDDIKIKKIENLEFIVTYLIGFDIYEVSEVFADVNFKQKPVNRSLYYDIFGSLPPRLGDTDIKNQIRLAHDIVIYLDTEESSSIKGMLKQLGTGKGFFSQAFVVDKLNKYLFNDGKIWNQYVEDFIHGRGEYKIIADFMIAYFSAIKESYPSSFPNDSNEKYSSVLLKTTGLGAFIRLIRDVYPIVSNDPKNFYQNIRDILSKLSDKDAKELFSSDGVYGKAGSEGMQEQLYQHLLKKLKLPRN